MALWVTSLRTIAKKEEREVVRLILGYGSTTNWHQLALVCSVQGCGQACRDAMAHNSFTTANQTGKKLFPTAATATRCKCFVFRLPCCSPSSWTGTVFILKTKIHFGKHWFRIDPCCRNVQTILMLIWRYANNSWETNFWKKQNFR